MTAWQVNDSDALLETSGLRVELHTARPEEGMKVGVPFSGALLGLRLPAPPMLEAEILDRYVRDTDLAVSYRASDAWPVRVDCVWRVESSPRPGILAQFELIVSVRTDLLDSQPSLAVESVLPTTEVLRLSGTSGGLCAMHPDRTFRADEGPGCLVARMPEKGLSYVEMVHPLDFHAGQLTAEANVPTLLRIRHHLFPDALEKGVLLRGWLRGLLISQSDDASFAAAEYASFAASEPPLNA
jgi:hypothetical protein